MKICSTCLEEKPREAYEKSPYGDGRRAQCKACRKSVKALRVASGPKVHGTQSTYTEYGCRCEPCKIAHQAYMTAYISKKKQTPKDTWTHGIAATYNNLKCRCIPCTSAAKEYAAKRWAGKTPEEKRSHKAKYIEHVISGRRSRRLKQKSHKLDKEDRQILNAYLNCSEGDACRYCGKVKENMHWDHFFPVAKGGTDHWFNMVRACQDCNLTKKDRCGTWKLLKKF